MSLGQQLLKAALVAGSPSVLRDVRDEFVLDEEKPLYQFVRQHLSQHGVLPSEETLQAAGFSLMRAKEPASYYVTEMRKRFAYNEINKMFPDLTSAMRSRDMNTAETLLRQAVQTIGSSLRPNTSSSLLDALTMVVDDYQYAKANPGLRGVTFGYPTLDEVTLGAQGGDIIVIAGRPGMGKSWKQGKMVDAAHQAHHSSLVVTMEMPVLQYTRRIVANRSGVNPMLIRKGELSSWGEQKMMEAIEELRSSATPVQIMAGDMSKNVQGIVDLAYEYSPDVIFIDAAYLLSPSIRKRGGYVSKWEQLSDVIRELKQLALSIDRPIIITVQFNRNVKKEQKKKLDLGDIAGTDTIPQDASVVVGIREGRSPFENSKRDVELLKNREGELKDYVMSFNFYPIDFSETTYPSEGNTDTVNVEWMT